jgi:hypothetical protein
MIRPIFANWFFQLPTLPLLLFSHQWAGPVKILLRQLHCSKSELPLNVNNYYKIVLYLKYFEIIGRRSLENPERHKGSLSSTSSSPKSGKSRLLNFRPNRRPPHKAAEAVSASSRSILCSIRRLYRNYYTNANSGQLCEKIHSKFPDFQITGPLSSADLVDDAPNICKLALPTTHPWP